jgi:hypothetical protein
MTKKLNKEELEKKKKFHEKKVNFYEDKIEAFEKEKIRIGFKWYD